MCGERGIIAVHETMHLVNFLAKVAIFFFRMLMLGCRQNLGLAHGLAHGLPYGPPYGLSLIHI